MKKEQCAAVVFAPPEMTADERARQSLQILDAFDTVVNVADEPDAARRLTAML